MQRSRAIALGLLLALLLLPALAGADPGFNARSKPGGKSAFSSLLGSLNRKQPAPPHASSAFSTLLGRLNGQPRQPPRVQRSASSVFLHGTNRSMGMKPPAR